MCGRRAAPAVALALLATLAGCAAIGPGQVGDASPTPSTPALDGDCGPAPVATPAPDDGATASAAPSPATASAAPSSATRSPTPSSGSVTVEGTLPDRVDADLDAIYRRTERLLGVRAPAPTVTVGERDRSGGSGGARAFRRATGLDEVTLDATAATGQTRGVGEIHLDPNGAPAAQVERALVHEFVHHVQFARGWELAHDDVPDPLVGTTEHRMLHFLTSEGPAVLVADAYAARYQDGRGQSDRLRGRFGAAPGNRYVWAPYVYGHRYARNHTDGPDDLAALYADPPTTTAQVVAGSDREVPVADLSVDAPTFVGGWRNDDTDVPGALVLTVLLWDDHGRAAAEEAAVGWRAGRLLRFRDDGAHGFVWVHRWATPADADDYLAAVEPALSPHGAVESVRLDDHTTAVAFGDAAFVETAAVGCDGGEVTVYERP